MEPDKGKDQSMPKTKKRALGLSYLIDENPPWYICLLLGLQVRTVSGKSGPVFSP